MKILKEYTLASDFSIGFELEGLFDFSDTYNENMREKDEFLNNLRQEEIQFYDVYEDSVQNLELSFENDEISKKEYEEEKKDLIEKKKDFDIYLSTKEEDFRINHVEIDERDEIEIIDNSFKPEIKSYWNGGVFTDDSSIIEENKYQTSFEYNSPILELRPENLSKLVEFLDILPEWNIKTNDSCGFHVHFSAKNINFNDIKWFILQFALDSDPTNFNTLVNFNDEIKFISEEFANIRFYESIQSKIENSSSKEETIEILKYNIRKMDDVKYVLFNAHKKYKTLEWRGVRRFLDDNNKHNIYKFIKKIYEFINVFNKLESKKTITEYNISKYEIFSLKDEIENKKIKGKLLSNWRNFLLTIFSPNKKRVEHNFNRMKSFIENKNYDNIFFDLFYKFDIFDDFVTDNLLSIFADYLYEYLKEEKPLQNNNIQTLLKIFKKNPKTENGVAKMLNGVNLSTELLEFIDDDVFMDLVEKHKETDIYEFLRGILFKENTIEQLSNININIKELNKDDFNSGITFTLMMDNENYEEYIEYGIKNNLIDKNKIEDIIIESLSYDIVKIKYLYQKGLFDVKSDKFTNLIFENLFKKIDNKLIKNFYTEMDNKKFLEIFEKFIDSEELSGALLSISITSLVSYINDKNTFKGILKSLKTKMEQKGYFNNNYGDRINKGFLEDILLGFNDKYVNEHEFENIKMLIVYFIDNEKLFKNMIYEFYYKPNNKKTELHDILIDIYENTYKKEMSFREWKKIKGYWS